MGRVYIVGVRLRTNPKNYCIVTSADVPPIYLAWGLTVLMEHWKQTISTLWCVERVVEWNTMQ